jgi:hypothetical protein
MNNRQYVTIGASKMIAKNYYNEFFGKDVRLGVGLP